MELYNLPEGWKSIKIGNTKYFDLIMGQSPPSSTYNLNGVGLPFFQGKAEFGAMYPVPVKYCCSPTRIAKKNDVLISVRAPVGPTNIADQDCCIGRGLAAIRCKNDKILPKYLLYSLRNIESWIAATVQDQGGGFTAIKRTQIEEISLPIPCLLEQKRIVTRIEMLTSRVEEVKKLIRETEAEITKFTPALLDKAFRGEL